MSLVRTHRPRRLGRTAAVLMIVASVLLACSAETSDPGGTALAITLTDFRIAPATLTTQPGAIRFDVYNKSPATHEFVVVQSDLRADSLPLGADGLSVDEDQVEFVDELGQVDTRATEILALDLPPDRYVVFCNLEGHYLGGMYATLQVSDA